MGYFSSESTVRAMYKSLRTREDELLRDLLRASREQRNLKQIPLSKRLKKPQSFVSKYESGERRLDVIELRQICGALRIDLVHFIRSFETMVRREEQRQRRATRRKKAAAKPGKKKKRSRT